MSVTLSDARASSQGAPASIADLKVLSLVVMVVSTATAMEGIIGSIRGPVFFCAVGVVSVVCLHAWNLLD